LPARRLPTWRVLSCPRLRSDPRHRLCSLHLLLGAMLKQRHRAWRETPAAIL
jgi:hypothetical protein